MQHTYLIILLKFHPILFWMKYLTSLWIYSHLALFGVMVKGETEKKTEEARKIRQKYSAYYLENLAFHDMQEIFIHSFFHSFSTMFITSSSPWIITWCLVTHGTMLRQIEALAMLILCGTISYIQFRYCLNGRWTSILEFIVYFFLIILIMNVTQEGIQVLGNKEIFFSLGLQGTDSFIEVN